MLYCFKISLKYILVYPGIYYSTFSIIYKNTLFLIIIIIIIIIITMKIACAEKLLFLLLNNFNDS